MRSRPAYPRVCASLREPVSIGDAAFHLTPYAGVSVLGQDGNSPKSLLDKARSAAAEARRSNSAKIYFFTDTLKLRSLARLDVAREMRDAIANRRNSASLHGPLRTRHRPFGRPGRLSALEPSAARRAARRRISRRGGDDRTRHAACRARCSRTCATISPPWQSHFGADTRLSFGALRHHMLQEDFADDIGKFLAEGGVPAERLELRISERTFAAMGASVYDTCTGSACRSSSTKSDEASPRSTGWRARRSGVFSSTARGLRRCGPIRSALKVCRAGISAAGALGLTPIATGVDDEAQRKALVELGCKHGSGDLYAEATTEFDTLIMGRASQKLR